MDKEIRQKKVYRYAEKVERGAKIQIYRHIKKKGTWSGRRIEEMRWWRLIAKKGGKLLTKFKNPDTKSK